MWPTRPDDVVVAEDPLDGARLCGRLDDHERLAIGETFGRRTRPLSNDRDPTNPGSGVVPQRHASQNNARTTGVVGSMVIGQHQVGLPPDRTHIQRGRDHGRPPPPPVRVGSRAPRRVHTCPGDRLGLFAIAAPTSRRSWRLSWSIVRCTGSPACPSPGSSPCSDSRRHHLGASAFERIGLARTSSNCGAGSSCGSPGRPTSTGHTRSSVRSDPLRDDVHTRSGVVR